MSGSAMRRTQVNSRLTVNTPDRPAPTEPINPATGRPKVTGMALPVPGHWLAPCRSCRKYRFATRSGAERAGVAYGPKVMVVKCPETGYHLAGEPSQASMGGRYNVR